jgi:hypothetical protein
MMSLMILSVFLFTIYYYDEQINENKAAGVGRMNGGNAYKILVKI